MTTWTSKSFAALSIFTLLSACDVVDTSTGLLANLAPPEDSTSSAPLTQAQMMRGKVTLVPPSGYCIDAASLSQSFAIMARCDKLGAKTGETGAVAGLLTVSLSRKGTNTPQPTPQEFATAGGLAVPSNIQQGGEHTVFKTSGTAPSPDLSSDHWRSIGQVGDFSMSAALYGPKGQRAISDEGIGVLEEMIKRSTQETNAS
ncbi:hypothetical protein [Sulfitobacter donghicola]|uniref:Dihydroxy-acid dehydratase n=1 Tax=Sulfitobacter donghicola DSW-25 = KCTC 12864 = JCM 14565 TaxID=1300350 RepID=A0A073IL77_9RHOB|nr:hypothetical protein [Sulfitobacter donghicola]KEJ91048.1 hypothetical protein DSW25_00745 [Sulfitobacter donghicola DSW-25 = KCTC 12864 = JCM 14565]KIN67717.1 Dihydroxy-acid dehydratase [Sulfitobacter donghicola DSW-25 = KCTC 12864 = JCM 14565]